MKAKKYIFMAFLTASLIVPLSVFIEATANSNIKFILGPILVGMLGISSLLFYFTYLEKSKSIEA